MKRRAEASEWWSGGGGEREEECIRGGSDCEKGDHGESIRSGKGCIRASTDVPSRTVSGRKIWEPGLLIIWVSVLDTRC
jgi:hypothetical protein